VTAPLEALQAAAVVYAAAQAEYHVAFLRWKAECPEESESPDWLEMPGWQRIASAACKAVCERRYELEDAAVAYAESVREGES